MMAAGDQLHTGWKRMTSPFTPSPIAVVPTSIRMARLGRSCSTWCITTNGQLNGRLAMRFLRFLRPKWPSHGSELASRFLFALAAVLCVALAVLELAYGQSPVLPIALLGLLLGAIIFSAGRPSPRQARAQALRYGEAIDRRGRRYNAFGEKGSR